MWGLEAFRLLIRVMLDGVEASDTLQITRCMTGSWPRRQGFGVPFFVSGAQVQQRMAWPVITPLEVGYTIQDIHFTPSSTLYQHVWAPRGPFLNRASDDTPKTPKYLKKEVKVPNLGYLT